MPSLAFIFAKCVEFSEYARQPNDPHNYATPLHYRVAPPPLLPSPGCLVFLIFLLHSPSELTTQVPEDQFVEPREVWGTRIKGVREPPRIVAAEVLGARGIHEHLARVHDGEGRAGWEGVVSEVLGYKEFAFGRILDFF